jgi:hypothetical protein
MSVHTNACTDSPNIDITHGGVIELADDRLALRAQFRGLTFAAWFVGLLVGLQDGQQ